MTTAKVGSPETKPLVGPPSNTGPAAPLIPKERYTSRAFHDLEIQKLWPRVWQMVCREEDIPKPGSFIEYSIGDQSILVVRQKDGQIRAMFNACLHRGTQLAQGAGRRNKFRCPFHAWTYDLDGTLEHCPSPEEFPAGTYRLGECKAGTWGGFVFINLDPGAEPLEEFLGPLPESIAPFRFEDQVITRWLTFIAPFNWKTAMDAFNEAYHFSGTHPQLLAVLDDVNSSYDLFGIHSRMINPIGTPSPRAGDVDEYEVLLGIVDAVQSAGTDAAEAERRKGFIEYLKSMDIPEGQTAREVFRKLIRQQLQAENNDLPGLSDEQLMEVHGWYIFPNLIFQIAGGENVAYRATPNGDDPDTCIFDLFNMKVLPPGADKKAVERQFLADYRDYDFGMALNQDFDNLPCVQKGMHAATLTGLRLASYQECRIRHMHDVLDQYVGKD